jgi:uncharacterized protein (DUF983 family)
MSFTWWGGLIGPKMLTHVKCPACGHTFNGKTGRDNTTGIILYSIGVIVLVGFLVVAMFAALGFLMVFTQ